MRAAEFGIVVQRRETFLVQINASVDLVAGCRADEP
jgi:hypothetical protein